MHLIMHVNCIIVSPINMVEDASMSNILANSHIAVFFLV